MTNADYTKALDELKLPMEDIDEVLSICDENPELMQILSNPSVGTAEKLRVIDSVFPEKLRGFIKYMCGGGDLDRLVPVIREYSDMYDARRGIVRAGLVCVSAPDSVQTEKLREFLCRRFGAERAVIDISFDKAIIGGFILSARGMEFDRSVKSALKDLKAFMKIK